MAIDVERILAARLTPQERRCLEGVADHLQAGQIADRLGLATTTVESHLASARRKLGVTSSRAAVQQLRQAGVLHTGYGEGFSTIVLTGESMSSPQTNGGLDDKHLRPSSVGLVGTGNSSDGDGGRWRTPDGAHAYSRSHERDGGTTFDTGAPEGNPGSRRNRTQSFRLHIPAIPPRGLLPRLGLVFIAAFLLVVMMAVLVSIHTLLQ